MNPQDFLKEYDRLMEEIIQAEAKLNWFLVSVFGSTPPSKDTLDAFVNTLRRLVKKEG